MPRMSCPDIDPCCCCCGGCHDAMVEFFEGPGTGEKSRLGNPLWGPGREFMAGRALYPVGAAEPSP